MSIPSSSPSPTPKAPSSDSGSSPSSKNTKPTAMDNPGANEAAGRLAEAIDDFLGDIEKKFKGISDEILTKLDDMAERCDRLEQEMLLREASSIDNTGSGSTAGMKGSISAAD
ncbi:hypothetical protein PV10_04176 [Exophiala mesophila]|uniref:Uncharacterized protein n=2 Tax=Exophiala mesophila TaxID=212818 RepID=A0A0D1ZDY4_EXOME|nr:uncharacterized protein PV10_04176 [Exophiala mesophila]KIV92917.1 hypothetical protein PV10_04176 [Exophiala mesophila]